MRPYKWTFHESSEGCYDVESFLEMYNFCISLGF